MSKRLLKSLCTWAVFMALFFCAKAQPAAQFSATPLSGCAPLVVQFQDQSTGSPLVWKWDLGNSTVSFLQNPAATYFTPGVYTVKLVVTNAAGADSIVKTQYITVYGLPTVNFGAPVISGCFPLSVQFTDNSLPGTGTITNYLWDFGDGNSGSGASPVHVYTAAGNYNVSLMVTNSNGCTKTLTRPNYITIGTGVHAVFANNTPLSCAAPVTIQFQNQSTGTGILSWQWNFGDGSTSTLPNPAHTYTSAGTYTVQLIATNSTGCRDTATHTGAIIIGSVNADFILPDPPCEGFALTFVNTSTPAPVSALWSFGDGTTSTAVSPIKIYSAAGTYSVKLVSNFGGCLDSITKTVTVLAKPLTSFTGAPLVSCSAPLTVNFSNTSSGGSTYEWIFGDGTTATSQNVSHTYTSAGTYSVTLITTNSNGCTDTLVRTNYVIVQPPIAAINNLPQQGCAPLTWTFSATVTSPDPIVSYLWSFGDGTTSTAVSPTHSFPAGIYDIQLIVTTAGGCTDTVTVAGGIKSSTKPRAGFSATPREACAMTPIVFTDESSGSITTWQWFFGDGAQSSEDEPSHTYNDTGYFSVTLVVGNNGCFDTLVIPNYIHILPPIAIFDVTFNCDEPLKRIFTDRSIGADTWTWNFGDGNTSATQSPTHIYSGPGSYQVSLTVKNNTTGCEFTKTQQVIVDDEHAEFTVSQPEICKNTSTIFTAAASGYVNGIVNFEWIFGDGTTGTGAIVNHTYIAAGLYTVTLIITDAVGCRDTLVRPNFIRVNGPTALFVPSLPGTCLLSVINFTDQSVTDGLHPISTWKWEYGDGISQTYNSPPFQHSYANAGLYTVSLVVKDAVGCTDSISRPNVLTISTPAADFISADTLSCPGQTISFTNNSTGPTLLYSWSFGDGATSVLQSPTHIYSAAGVYTVNLNITDLFGCSAAVSKPQYIKIVDPVANFSVSDSVSTCPPLIVQFSNLSQNQTTFSWDFGDGTSSSAISPSHFYNVPGTYTATLNITGPGGCTSVKTKIITVRGPQGTFEYSNPVGCSPLTVSFTAHTQDRTSFIWDFNDGTTTPTTDSVITHTYNIPGVYVPKMILKDAAGCTVPVTGLDTIRVNGVDASFKADTLLRCTAGLVVFTDSSVSNETISSYLWDFGDGSNSSAANPSHFYSAEGNYTVKLKVQTVTGCSDSVVSTLPIRVVKTPEVSITAPLNGCTPLSLSLQGNLLNGDTSAITWQWNLSNGQTFSGQGPSTTTITAPGIYSAVSYVVNSTGCRDTANAGFEVYALPNIVADADKIICEGRGQAISATGGATYSWSPSTGLSCTACQTPVATPASETIYAVSGTSAQGCVNRDSIKVSVKFPFSMRPGPGDTLCTGQSTTLTSPGAFSYQWSPSAGLNSTTTATVTARPDTTTRYRVVGYDDIGCFTDTAYFNVKVYPIPGVNAGDDKTINVGQSVTLTPTISADVTSIVWTPSTSIISSTFPSVIVKPTETTQYRVTATNGGGCTSNDLITLYVLCNGANVFIPNTFSPNGDGNNEVFYPRGTGLFTIRSAKIFNRWGEVVFQRNDFAANNETMGWNGTFKGQKLQPDVFIYMIEIVCENNTILVYKGNVTLLR